MRTSKQACIEALQLPADILGHSPSIDEYAELGLRPGNSIIQERVSNWNAAKEAADLETHGSRHRPAYIVEECRDALRTVNTRVEDTMGQKRYENYRDDDHPYYQTIIHHLGSFTEIYGVDVETVLRRWSYGLQ